MMRILLASKSPRRKELLEVAGFNFEIQDSDLDESKIIGTTPEDLALKLAELKAEAVAKKNTDALVLGADTIVICDNIDPSLGMQIQGSVVLGKPENREHAKKMLLALSDREHRVITAFSLISIYSSIKITKHVETKVRFRKINSDELEKYLDSTEPYDKAGAYGAQGFAQSFITSINGSYTNVVGLPLAEVSTEIRGMLEHRG